MTGSVIGAATAVLAASVLAVKWQLGVRRVVIAVGLLGAATALVVALLVDGVFRSAVVACGLTLLAAAAVLAQRFYRDPERVAPGGPGVVVSPADGEVVYVRHSVGGAIPVVTKHGRDHRLEELLGTRLAYADAVVVGIAMSFLDVHVNRSPVSGLVTHRHHLRGLFQSLRRTDSVVVNERATTVIETEGLQIAVVQIASRLVRQIVGFVDAGDHVRAGDRIGVIRLGSQVDLVLPAGARVLVSAGDRVRAGESVLAVLGHGRDSGEGRDARQHDVQDPWTP